jgi:hypothetical protein
MLPDSEQTKAVPAMRGMVGLAHLSAQTGDRAATDGGVVSFGREPIDEVWQTSASEGLPR